MKLILASNSATRRAMLVAAGVVFETSNPDVDEDAGKAGLEMAGFDPRGIAEELARLKALSVDAVKGSLVLGSDQTLERADGTMLSKPGSRADAFDQLRSLSGATHLLHSAAVIAEEGQAVWWACETVAMKVRTLSDVFLDRYLDSEYDAVRWNVGAYRIEGRGVQLFERIEGSHFAILGMPLLPLISYLGQRGLVPS